MSTVNIPLENDFKKRVPQRLTNVNLNCATKRETDFSNTNKSKQRFKQEYILKIIYIAINKHLYILQNSVYFG